MRKAVAVGAVGVLGLVGLGACGGDGDSVSVERDGTSVEVDKDGGSVKVESDDGDSEVSVGEGAKIPDDFPSDVPLPDGGKVGLAGQNEADGKQSFHVTYTVDPDDVDDVFSDYRDALENAGFDLGDSANIEGSGGSFASLQATGKGWQVTAVKLGSSGSEDGGISITVTEAES